MILDILNSLSPTPGSTQLPKKIKLSQRLSTDKAPESVSLTFGLADANDVWFKTADGVTKTLTLQAVIEAEGDLVQELNLVRDRGLSVPFAEIRETITDSAGRITPDVCTLRIR